MASQSNLKLCKYGCETQIRWDSKLSAFVEIDGRLHDFNRCKDLRGSDTPKYTRQPSSTTTAVGTRNTEIAERLEAVLGNTLDMIARFEKLDKRLEELRTMFLNLKVGQRVLDPSNDDGDSQRENPEREDNQ